MPCMKCSNGKYKYGANGNCQFDTLAACKAAAAVIHINQPGHGPHGPNPDPQPAQPAMEAQLDYSCEDCHDEFLNQYKDNK